MRTGSAYLAALSDGREVIVNGERVKNVATHPAFAGICQTVTGLYDFIGSHQEEMTFRSPSNGQPVSLCHLIPRSIADLKRRRRALTLVAERTFGLLGRSPEHVASFFAAFASAPELFATQGAHFGENILRFQRKIRDEHLYVTYAIIPPQVDRSKTAHEQAESHIPAGVVRKTDEGIVIRGAQMLGTAAVISDYLFLSCIQPLRPGDEDYAISLVVPINAPGLRLYPRRPYALGQPSVFDYPLSTRFDESDSLVVFHDTFVPWENVFVYRDLRLTRAQWFETPAHILGNTQAQIRLATKVKFLAGLARKICSTNGVDKIPSVNWDLGEIASLASVVEGMVLAAETSAVTNVNGVVHPNPRFLYGAMALQSQLYPRLVHLLRELIGGGTLQVPSSVFEFHHADTAADLRRYVQSPGVKAEDRVKLFKLAWEMVGSEFAGRHQQYEMFYAGAPYVAKNYSFLNYDFREGTDLVEACLQSYGLDVDSGLPTGGDASTEDKSAPVVKMNPLESEVPTRTIVPLP